jgi:hypothetical protein
LKHKFAAVKSHNELVADGIVGAKTNGSFALELITNQFV